MSLTITINTPAPATLTVGVGVPGATGPAGAAGQGVPVGGTAGQFLTKINSTNYNTDWTTLPAYLQLAGGTMNVNAAIDLSDSVIGTVSEVGGYGFAVSSASNINLKTNVLFDRVLVSNATGATTLKPTGVEFPDLTLQTTAGISAATAASTYAITSRGQPASGTVGQVLTKNSGTNYDSSWATLIPGDRYLTTSTTSNTIGNGAKTFTVGTGLSYTPTQDVTISYDASKHMHAEVTTYNSGTGVLVVDVKNHTGAGTFAAWTVNVGGVTPLASVAWGDITGTLGNQTDLANALNAKLELSGGAMTGAITNTGAVYSCEITDAQILVNTNSSNDQAYHAANGFFTSYNQATSSGSTLRQVWIDNEGLSNTQAPLGDVGGHNVFIKPTIFSSAVYSPSETTESFQITKDGILCQRLNPAGGGYQTIQFSNAGLLFSDGTTQTTAYTGGTPSVAWGSITGSLSSQSDLQSELNSKWSYSFSQIAGDLTQGTSYSGVIGSPPSGGKVLGFNGYYNAMEWIANPAPSSSEAVWIYGGWQSASIKNVLDMGSYSYYNVLTF